MLDSEIRSGRMFKNCGPVLAAGVIALLAGCKAPPAPDLHVHVHGLADEYDVSIYKDGTRVRLPGEEEDGDDAPEIRPPVPESGVRMQPGYYGRVHLQAEGPQSTEHVADRREVTKLVDFEAPAPMWLFPLDFGIEAIRYLVSGSPTRFAKITLPAAKRETQSATLLDDAEVLRSVEATRKNAVRR